MVRLPLGTPAEKDVGYPYAASWGDASADVIAAMAEYSWQRHLIRHGAYSDWVDRGRMRPAHRQWGAYLREVAEVASARASLTTEREEIQAAEASPEALAAGTEIVSRLVDT